MSSPDAEAAVPGAPAAGHAAAGARASHSATSEPWDAHAARGADTGHAAPGARASHSSTSEPWDAHAARGADTGHAAAGARASHSSTSEPRDAHAARGLGGSGAGGGGRGVDTLFSLPAVDDPPMTETGVILMGLDAERLLTGLGLATVTDDPALIALSVDQLRHGGVQRLPAGAMLAEGTSRWLSAREVLQAVGGGGTTSGSPRQAWANALRLVCAADIGDAGPATRAYLAACWLRRGEVDARAARGPAEGATGCPT